MNKQVSWIFEFSIHAGEVGNVKALMQEMVKDTQDNEPGTLAYRWFINEETNQCHIYEWYKDSAATVAHLATFKGTYAARLLAMGTPTRFVVYGNPDATVYEALDGFGAVYMSSLGGFVR